MTREEAISCFHKFMNNEPISIPTLEKAMQVAIKALEQEPKSEWEHDHEILRAYFDGASEVLDKISAEIEELFSYVEFDDDTKTSYNMVRLEEVQRVIDKYNAESEET